MDTSKFSSTIFFGLSLHVCVSVNILCAEPTRSRFHWTNRKHIILPLSPIRVRNIFFFIWWCFDPHSNAGKIEILKWNRGDKLTVIIVNIIVAIHFQLNGAIGTRPAFDAHAFVFTILKCTLTMTRTSIFATSFRESTPKKREKRINETSEIVKHRQK